MGHGALWKLRDMELVREMELQSTTSIMCKHYGKGIAMVAAQGVYSHHSFNPTHSKHH